MQTERVVESTLRSNSIHRASVRVQFEDCDAMGVVYHPNYFRFIERSRVDFLRVNGLPFAEMLRDGFGLVIAEINANFWRPCRFEDEIYVYTRQIELSEKTIRLEQFISKTELQDDQFLKPMDRLTGKIFGATIVLVSVSLQSLKSVPIPKAMSEKLGLLTVKIG